MDVYVEIMFVDLDNIISDVSVDGMCVVDKLSFDMCGPQSILV